MTDKLIYLGLQYDSIFYKPIFLLFISKSVYLKTSRRVKPDNHILIQRGNPSLVVPTVPFLYLRYKMF